MVIKILNKIIKSFLVNFLFDRLVCSLYFLVFDYDLDLGLISNSKDIRIIGLFKIRKVHFHGIV